MIAWAVLVLLRLDGLVVHVHVVLDRRHIFMAQQFLQAERVMAQHQVADGKRMPEDMRADAFEEQRDPIFGQRQARL